MRIEDYWEDRTAYYISFLTLDERKIYQIIFLPSEIAGKEEIKKIIMTNFNGVKEVLTIDEWGMGLLLKG